MPLSYEYSVGSVRAREKALLSMQDIELLAAAGSAEELASLLRDKGYEGESIDKMLSNRTKEIWSYVESVAPDMKEFDALLYRNDLHNIKAVIKGTLSGKKYEQLLLSPNTIACDDIIKAVQDVKFDRLPAWIAEAAREAYDIIAHNSDARLGDAVLDKAAMQAMLDASEKLSENIREYFETLVFYNNVKLVLRSSRTGVTFDCMMKMLCPVRGADITVWARKAASGSDDIIGLLSNISEFNCSEAIACFKKSPSQFERFVDSRLISVMRRSRYTVSGVEPLMGYVLANEAEIKQIHIVYSGIRTGAGEQFIRERLRNING